MDVASPAACGALDAAGAAQAVVSGLDSFVIPSVNAFAMVDTSATLARALSVGSTGTASPVGSIKSAIQDLRDTFANDWLVPANVENTDGGAVTFLIPPSILCSANGDGGPPPAGSNDLDGGSADADAGDCASLIMDHPLRVRVYSVGCDAGTPGVEMDWLLGPDESLLLGLEIDASSAYLRFFLAPLATDGFPLVVTSTSSFFSSDGGGVVTSTSSSAVLGKLDPGAAGVLTVTLAKTDTQGTRALLAVPQAIDVGITPDGGPRVGLSIGASDAVVDVTASGDGQGLSGSLGLGDTKAQTTLGAFIQSEFSRNLVASADTNAPVFLETSGLTGQIAYTTSGDSLTVTELGLGSAGAHAFDDAGDLVHVDVAPDAGGAVSFTAAASGADGGVAVTFAPDFSLALRYSMARIAPEVQDLENYASDDLLTISLSGGNPSSATLLPGSSSTVLDLVGSQTGPLLQVQSGELDLTSTFAPDASVRVTAPACLVRTPGQTGAHDLLEDLSSGACE